MRFPVLLVLSLIAVSALNARRATSRIYRTKWYVSGSIAAVGAVTNNVGLRRLRNKQRLDQHTLDALDREALPHIDRWALRQDPLKKQGGELASDRVFQSAAVLPLTLFFAEKFRRDWGALTLIYLETQMLASNFYANGPIGPGVTNRYRPLAYYQELSDEERGSGNNRNSFFSGHVSCTATGTFTFASFLSDYNPQWTGTQRAICFGLAAVPPAFVALQRVRALKHFPTDTVAGLAVGAFFGRMVASLHKRF